MSPQELDLLRVKVKLEVMLTLHRGLYTGLANSSPAAMEAMKIQFSNLRNGHAQIAIKGLAPEYSDMVSGEYQEALEDALSFIEAGFHS